MFICVGGGFSLSVVLVYTQCICMIVWSTYYRKVTSNNNWYGWFLTSIFLIQQQRKSPQRWKLLFINCMEYIIFSLLTPSHVEPVTTVCWLLKIASTVSNQWSSLLNSHPCNVFFSRPCLSTFFIKKKSVTDTNLIRPNRAWPTQEHKELKTEKH